MSDAKKISPGRDLPLLHLAWRNTLRNGRRTLLTVMAVTVAVGAMTFGLAYMRGMIDNMLDTFARIESGHVRIRKEGYTQRERSLPLYLNIPDLDRVLGAVRALPGVRAVLPRIRTAVLVDDARSNRTGLLMGIDFEGEEGFLNPAQMTASGRLPQAGRREIMVGAGFADKLGVSVGDSLTLLGQTAYRSLGGIRLAVTGMAATGMAALDRKMLLAPLDQVQLMAEMGDAATEILVFADDPEAADTLARRVEAAVSTLVEGGVEVRTWREQGPLVRTLDSAKPILVGVMLMLTLMASLVIVNTMLMTVMERTRELGTLAALGMRRTGIVALIVAEGAVIGLIGAFIGGAIGAGIVLWLQHTGIDISAAAASTDLPFQGIIYPEWALLDTLGSALMGIVAATLAALYPAWRAVQQKPAEALRS